MDETFDVQSKLKCFEENEIVQAARRFIKDELSKLYLAPKNFRKACNVARELGYSDEELETFKNDYDRGEYDIAVIVADKKKFLVAVIKEIGINDIADMFFFDSKHLALILENAPFLFWNDEGRSPQVYLNKEKQQFYEKMAIQYSLDILRGIAPINSGRANFRYIKSNTDCFLSPKAFSLPWILGHGRDNDKYVVVDERVKTPENLKLLQKHQCGELSLFPINVLQQYAFMRHNLLQSIFEEAQFKDSTAEAPPYIGTNGNTQLLPKPKPVTQTRPIEEDEIIDDPSNGLEWLQKLFPNDDKIKAIHREMMTYRGNKSLSPAAVVWLQKNLFKIALNAMSDDDRKLYFDPSLKGNAAFTSKNKTHIDVIKKTGWKLSVKTFKNYLERAENKQ